jgi:hypothetical protein
LTLNDGVQGLVLSRLLRRANATITVEVYVQSAVEMHAQVAGIIDWIIARLLSTFRNCNQLGPIGTAMDFHTLSVPPHPGQIDKNSVKRAYWV